MISVTALPIPWFTKVSSIPLWNVSETFATLDIYQTITMDVSHQSISDSLHNKRPHVKLSAFYIVQDAI